MRTGHKTANQKIWYNIPSVTSYVTA